jgi:hypothetical protein
MPIRAFLEGRKFDPETIRMLGIVFEVTLATLRLPDNDFGAVAGVVGIEGGVVSGVFNLESSDVRASDWRPRHDKRYHEA